MHDDETAIMEIWSQRKSLQRNIETVPSFLINNQLIPFGQEMTFGPTRWPQRDIPVALFDNMIDSIFGTAFPLSKDANSISD